MKAFCQQVNLEDRELALGSRECHVYVFIGETPGFRQGYFIRGCVLESSVGSDFLLVSSAVNT